MVDWVGAMPLCRAGLMAGRLKYRFAILAVELMAYAQEVIRWSQGHSVAYNSVGSTG